MLTNKIIKEINKTGINRVLIITSPNKLINNVQLKNSLNQAFSKSIKIYKLDKSCDRIKIFNKFNNISNKIKIIVSSYEENMNITIPSVYVFTIFNVLHVKYNYPENKQQFCLIKYCKLLDINIRNILLRPEKNILTYDILDTNKSTTNKLKALKLKQRQMKNGEIWQIVFGNYDGCINLKIGHETSLDILSHTKKFAIELKTRTNTDNASSKKTNFDKLAKFKINNPTYVCIYANINDNTEQKTLHGSIKKIFHNGVEIEQHIGYKCLNFILGDDTDFIIDFVKTTIDKYT